MQIISCNIYDPTKSIFKTKRTEHAECEITSCSLQNCSLRDKGECLRVGSWLFFVSCPYGSNSCETGPTRRAKSYYKWVEDRRKQYVDVPNLKNPKYKLTFVGDYIYLPYAHMSMCKAVPFLKHSCAFVSGIPLIPKESWTLDTVLKLIEFKPMALMGGEIKDYQKEEIPKFIQHLREEDPKMFELLTKEKPQFNVMPNYIGRKAILKTLNFPISWCEVKNEKYPVDWQWDGVKLITKSKHAYNTIWGSIDLESLELIGIPKDSTVVVVQNNNWVNENTVFED